MHLFPPDQELPSQKQPGETIDKMRANKLLASTSSFFTYQLGPCALYVPLTCRCNSRTLPELRGDNFMLPAPVVAALCRVRDAETATDHPQWAGWCAYLDTQEGSQKLPPPLEPIATCWEYPQEDKEHRPTVDELWREIQAQLHPSNGSSQIKSIVFSGEGEPTLRFKDMLTLAQTIKDHSTHDISIRLTTNGLATAAVVDSSSSSSSSLATITTTHDLLQQCVESGISHVSVGLYTGDADQFMELVQPVMTRSMVDSSSTSTTPHERVCEWIRTAVSMEGLEVEVTAVERPDVDRARTEELSRELGVETPVRWRPYFP
jgi:organic radical activating enzyme